MVKELDRSIIKIENILSFVRKKKSLIVSCFNLGTNKHVVNYWRAT